jgi:hypothetical protein
MDERTNLVGDDKDDNDDDDDDDDDNNNNNGKNNATAPKVTAPHSDTVTPLLLSNPTETVQLLLNGEETEQQWGGHVVVVTSTQIPGDYSEDEADDDEKHEPNNQGSETNVGRGGQQPPRQNKIDTEQVYAGNIEKYLKNMKGNLPSKKGRKTTSSMKHLSATRKQRGGQHGAMQMKGVGSGADMKVAQKMLARSTSKTKVKSGKQHGIRGKR